MLAASTPPWLGVPSTVRQLAAGELLFHQGERTFGVFSLARGCVRLQRFTPAGAVVPMHTVREGESFAEAALFAEHYHCQAEALRTSEVLVYPRAALLDALRGRPDAGLQLAHDLAQRVQQLRQKIELRQPRSAAERVLLYLRLHADRAGMWTAPGSLKEWAEDIGLTHEALYRTLARLEQDGRLLRCGTQLTLQPEGDVR
jgi:CRP-like cAMP-binding protein